MKRLKPIFIWAALGLYAVILAELCVRWMAPTPLMPRYITGTPWGVRGNIPGARYRHVTAEVDVGYRINSQGMRSDRDFPLAPDPQRCRIAMIGDSFFMGYELELRDTIAAGIETSLQAAGTPAEVLNFSVSGLGTAEMLRTYEARIRQFAPDVVVMQWHLTDIEDNLRSNLYAMDGDGVRRAASSYLPSVDLQDKLMRWWLYRMASDHSQFYSVMREGVGTAAKNLLSRQGGKREAAGQAPNATPDTTGVELAGRLISEARKQVEADGRNFLLVEIPDYSPAGPPVSAWSRIPPSSVHDVPVIHAGDEFRQRLPAGTKLYYENGHFHLTPAAARAVAQAVAATLLPQLQTGSCAIRLASPL